MEREYHSVEDRLWRMSLTVRAHLTGETHPDQFISCCHAQTASRLAGNISRMTEDCRVVLVGGRESGTVAHSFLTSPDGEILYDSWGGGGIFSPDKGTYQYEESGEKLSVLWSDTLAAFFDLHLSDIHPNNRRERAPEPLI